MLMGKGIVSLCIDLAEAVNVIKALSNDIFYLIFFFWLPKTVKECHFLEFQIDVFSCHLNDFL